MKNMGTVCAAGLLLMGVACSNPAPSNVATPTASVTSSKDFRSDASRVVEDLAAGRFADVESKFDATMKAQLPATQLLNAWRTYQEAEGTYRRHGQPAQVMQGQIAVERVPIATTSGAGEVRVSYHPDGTIAGIYFLKAGAPAP
jgi:hypothetical protein